jgi:hypothetical protein
VTYKTKRMQYKIDDRVDGFRYVDGYAIDSGLPVRVCVHRVGRRWKCDHFDSGFAFGPSQNTMREAVRFAVARMRHAIESGEFDISIKECGL